MTIRTAAMLPKVCWSWDEEKGLKQYADMKIKKSSAEPKVTFSLPILSQDSAVNSRSFSPPPTPRLTWSSRLPDSYIVDGFSSYQDQSFDASFSSIDSSFDDSDFPITPNKVFASVNTRPSLQGLGISDFGNPALSGLGILSAHPSKRETGRNHPTAVVEPPLNPESQSISARPKPSPTLTRNLSTPTISSTLKKTCRPDRRDSGWKW
ncbi:hypothetical protein C8J56DRAFT_1047404 [Mycena floridula]|nr:hypothetical protein C8J56DRAFT_1047404 [Mycena floridula]